MINLRPYYDPGDHRTICQSPLSVGERTIATNGHIIISVPRVDGYPNADEETAGLIKSLLPKAGGEYITLDYDKTLPEHQECCKCQGTGISSQEECPECESAGIVDLYNGFHTYDAMCKTCWGQGFVKGEEAEVCRSCWGEGKIYSPEQYINILGVGISPRYYKMLKNTAPDLLVCRTDRYRIDFKNFKCKGAVMGCREMTD